MNLKRAQEIAGLLGNGVHPITGEILPSTSVVQEPEIIRALLFLSHNTKGVRAKSLPENQGKKWLDKDDAALINSFQNGMSVGELARLYKRTNGSIKARLIRLKLIDND